MRRSDKYNRHDDDYRDIRPHGASKRHENKSRRHNDRQKLRDFIGYNGRTSNEREENYDEDND
jgi:hypothetical protein